MLKPINLLLNKVKGKAAQLYPGQEAKINNLTEDTAVLKNFTTISSSLGKYKTDITDGENINAVEQAWTAAQLIDLESAQNNFPIGTLTQVLASGEPGAMMTVSPRTPNLFFVMEDVSDEAAVLNSVFAAIGYSLTSSDYTLTHPVTDYEDYIYIKVKSPYLLANIYVYPKATGFKTIPNMSIGFPTYAATGKTTQLSLMEILLYNAWQNGWSTELTQEEFNTLVSAARYPYVLFNEDYLRYDDGNVRYISNNGCAFPAVNIGYDNLSYQVWNLDRTDFFNWTDLTSTDDLANVTTPGFYRIPNQFFYKYWLMVDDFTTVNKDLFNIYSTKIWLSEKEAGYRVNGMGDYGTPDATYKYRGSYNLENLLMHNESIYIRRIGE